MGRVQQKVLKGLLPALMVLTVAIWDGCSSKNQTAMTAQDWVQKLDMKPHPEGGFYKETYRSVGSIPVEGLPATYGSERSYATGIYFLLDGENFSALHRLKQDEMWHFYAGSRLLVHLIDSTGNYNQIQLGPDVDAGEVFQAVVPGGSYFGSEVQDKSSFALVGCTVSPGFDFRDFEMPSAEELLAQYPQHESVIRRMTRH